VGERSSRGFLFTPIVPGLQDYVPRGTVISSPIVLEQPNPITIFTAGGSGMLTMAAVKRVLNTNNVFSVTATTGSNFVLETQPSTVSLPQTSSLDLVIYELTPELLTYSKYIYVLSDSVQLVTGPDDSPQGPNLRFTALNQIKVYVNGVELDPSGYDRTVDNQITFTPAIYDTNNVVEILVYQNLTAQIDPASLIRLHFVSLLPTVPTDLAFREINCWGDYQGVIVEGQPLINFFCSDLSLLYPTASYVVTAVEATSSTGTVVQVDPANFFLMLGSEPYNFRDKSLHAYIEGSTLINDQAILTYTQSQATGDLNLTLDGDSVTQVFNTLTLFGKIPQITSLAAVTGEPGTALGTEELKPKYILGPS
jgi:hypothetical protein